MVPVRSRGNSPLDSSPIWFCCTKVVVVDSDQRLPDCLIAEMAAVAGEDARL